MATTGRKAAADEQAMRLVEPVGDGIVAAPEGGVGASAELYERLAAPFETTHRSQRGGLDLEYITGEQCVSRLNQVLGPFGWSFVVREHGVNAEADEIWVLGELSLQMGAQTAVRQQFGSKKVSRNRSTGTPVDVGFDSKAAATDALKKCASLIGVGLYLSRQEAPAVEIGPVPVPPPSGGPGHADAEEGLSCEECGKELGEVRFRDGTAWLPAQLASLGRRKHGRVLCMDHYRQANDARRRAETQESVGF